MFAMTAIIQPGLSAPENVGVGGAKRQANDSLASVMSRKKEIGEPTLPVKNASGKKLKAILDDIVNPEEELKENGGEPLQSAYIIPLEAVKVAYEAADASVVSILEGYPESKDIRFPRGFQAELVNTGDGPVETELGDIPATEILARMPAPGRTENAEKSDNAGFAALVSENGDPYPLENENDTLFSRPVQKSKIPAEGVSLGGETGPEKAEDGDSSFRVFPAMQKIDVAPEKVFSEQQLKAASEPTVSTAENLFETMVENIEASASADGSDQLEIQLKPDFLGKVSIKLSMTENGLQAKIQADDPNVKSLINGQISQLIESLSEKGIKVAGVDVVYTGVAEQGFDQSGRKHEGGQKERPRSYGAAAISESFDAELPVWSENIPLTADMAASRVDYRA